MSVHRFAVGVAKLLRAAMLLATVLVVASACPAAFGSPSAPVQPDPSPSSVPPSSSARLEPDAFPSTPTRARETTTPAPGAQHATTTTTAARPRAEDRLEPALRPRASLPPAPGGRSHSPPEVPGSVSGDHGLAVPVTSSPLETAPVSDRPAPVGGGAAIVATHAAGSPAETASRRIAPRRADIPLDVAGAGVVLDPAVGPGALLQALRSPWHLTALGRSARGTSTLVPGEGVNHLLLPAALTLLVLIMASGSFLSLAYRIQRGGPA